MFFLGAPLRVGCFGGSVLRTALRAPLRPLAQRLRGFVSASPPCVRPRPRPLPRRRPLPCSLRPSGALPPFPPPSPSGRPLRFGGLRRVAARFGFGASASASGRVRRLRLRVGGFGCGSGSGSSARGRVTNVNPLGLRHFTFVTWVWLSCPLSPPLSITGVFPPLPPCLWGCGFGCRVRCLRGACAPLSPRDAGVCGLLENIISPPARPRRHPPASQVFFGVFGILHTFAFGIYKCKLK